MTKEGDNFPTVVGASERYASTLIDDIVLANSPTLLSGVLNKDDLASLIDEPVDLGSKKIFENGVFVRRRSSEAIATRFQFGSKFPSPHSASLRHQLGRDNSVVPVLGVSGRTMKSSPCPHRPQLLFYGSQCSRRLDGKDCERQ